MQLPVMAQDWLQAKQVWFECKAVEAKRGNTGKNSVEIYLRHPEM